MLVCILPCTVADAGFSQKEQTAVDNPSTARQNSATQKLRLDVCGPEILKQRIVIGHELELSYQRPKTSNALGKADYTSQTDGTGLANLLAGKARARCAFRRQVFHRCADHKNLLPSDLPLAHIEGKQRALLPDRRSRSRSGFSPVPALPP